MKRISFGSEQWGWYAYAENDVLVIGESFPHEGGDLYVGEYKGKDTPYLIKLKVDCPKIYNKIVNYFEKEIKNTEEFKYLSDMERLKKVFAKFNPRNLDTNLYYAVLAVVSENDSDREIALKHFKKYARDYLYDEK